MSRADRNWVTAGIEPASLEALAGRLPGSALWSLLLDVFARRVERCAPAGVLRQFERDTFTTPASVDQRTLVALDAHLLAAASAFEAIELSPLAPLGACAAMGRTSQNKIVSALRGTEVVSDPTNVLALECARRLRVRPDAPVRLATCHRCVRAQEIPKRPGFAHHFRIFCLATGGRERRDHAFVVEALRAHVATHMAALDALERHGYAFGTRRLTVLAAPERAALGDRVAAGVQGADVRRDVLAHAYYGGLRFLIDVETTAGDRVPLVDGGAFDWLQRLTSNRRMTYVASGMGSQLAAHLCRR